MKLNYACGVDVGGSHVTAALIDTVSNSIIPDTVRRSKIDASKSADEIVNAWTAVIRQVLQQIDQKSVNIGIAMPGPFDYKDGISYIQGQHKYDSLYSISVKNLLADVLGQPADTITFANDAACFLQGEVAGGVARGRENVMGFTLGTGLGSAIYNHGIAEDADLWRSPFLAGMAEDYLSTRWFVGRYAQLTGNNIGGVKEMVELYPSSDVVREIFDEFGMNFGRFIRQAIDDQDIEMVVLGGNIAQAIDLFARGMDTGLTDFAGRPEVKRSILNEHAALLGAVSINTLITAL